MQPVTPLTLTKHEGLGNDFLVLLDAGGDVPLPPHLVQRLCDRRRGVGADGLMRATRPAGSTPAGGGHVDAVMELYNADGSRAEMSGNGIRCLAQALLLAGWAGGPRLVVATDAGVRHLSVVGRSADGPAAGVTHRVAVDMGRISPGPEAAGWAQPRGVGGPEPSRFRARWASAGNPHLVLEVADPAAVAALDLVELGQKVNADVPAGSNVHLLAAGPGPQRITLRTYERGVGLTEACGTGACASAVVASEWGLVGAGAPVVVAMPGGEAQVRLEDDREAGGGRDRGTTAGDGPAVTLTGPATSIARLEYPWPARA